ncbi:MAG: hypothetical protein ACOC43_13750 [Desulfohalobiaceae bacterium]
MKEQKRKQNEKKFHAWEELSEGGRCYWLEVIGKFNWKAKYIKKVDSEERTLSFHQEIYNNLGILVEIHEKYPRDKGHKIIKE